MPKHKVGDHSFVFNEIRAIFKKHSKEQKTEKIKYKEKSTNVHTTQLVHNSISTSMTVPHDNYTQRAII